MPELGYWRISIALPENRDNKGTLYLYDPDGQNTFICECLGRGSNHEDNDFDHTDWWKTNADTPTGVYSGSIIPPASDTAAYGPYKRVNMVACYEEDHADIAAHSGYFRSGIQIHGGREGRSTPDQPWYPLWPTYGCIRVSNDNQNTIISLIESYEGTGKVEVKGLQKDKS